MHQKEIVYTVNTDTEKGIKEAEKIQRKLYETYNVVKVHPNGLHQVKIVATNS